MSTVLDVETPEAVPGTDSGSLATAVTPPNTARAVSGKREPKPKTLRQRVAKELMMMARRIHLFSGLFMFPWVLLYGFTGWFFNHPGYFSSDQARSFAAADVADGQLARLPTPEQVAADVVDELSIASAAAGGPTVELSESPAARYDRYLSFNVNAAEQTHVVEVHPITGAGVVRTNFVSDSSPEPPTNPLSDIPKIELVDNTQTIAQAAVPGLLADLGLPTGEVRTGRATPSLIFNALVDGKPCQVTYNMGSGTITAKPDDAPPGQIETKAFLQRLHLSRGYSPSMSTRTWWAVSVDAMFLSMVFWGFSGILMWWQIKRTRKIGFAVLLSSALCATWLVIGMHSELTSTMRGRGGHGGGPPAAQPRDGQPRDGQPAGNRPSGSTGNISAGGAHRELIATP